MIMEEQSPLLQNLTDIDISIIKQMCECDMNRKRVAKAVYMHRNTVDYHIFGIKEKTGYDIRKFYDLVALSKIIKDMEQK